MKKIAIMLGMLMLAGSAFAKLPAMSDEAKAKADEAKAKTAWNDKISAYKLCQRQDKVAANYLKSKGTKPAVAANPCQDPGPFVAPVAGAATAPTVMAAAGKPAVAAAPATPAKK